MAFIPVVPEEGTVYLQKFDSNNRGSLLQGAPPGSVFLGVLTCPLPGVGQMNGGQPYSMVIGEEQWLMFRKSKDETIASLQSEIESKKYDLERRDQDIQKMQARIKELETDLTKSVKSETELKKSITIHEHLLVSVPRLERQLGLARKLLGEVMWKNEVEDKK